LEETTKKAVENPRDIKETSTWCMDLGKGLKKKENPRRETVEAKEEQLGYLGESLVKYKKGKGHNWRKWKMLPKEKMGRETQNFKMSENKGKESLGF
jgi:hypothetical protein